MTKGKKVVIAICIAVLVLVGLSSIIPKILRMAAKPPEVTIDGNPVVIGETKLQDLPGYTASKVDNPLMLRLSAQSWESFSLDRGEHFVGGVELLNKDTQDASLGNCIVEQIRFTQLEYVDSITVDGVEILGLTADEVKEKLTDLEQINHSSGEFTLRRKSYPYAVFLLYGSDGTLVEFEVQHEFEGQYD